MDSIPKIIHYCWFGGNPLPELAQKCIESWRKYCPDYEIKRWDETNFDINCNDYVKEAYDSKKWAFVTDYVRLFVLVNYGGIYMDTDVEVIKPLDSLLIYEAVSGFESDQWISTGLMASRRNHKIFVELLLDYDLRNFKKKDGTFDTTTNVETITNLCKKHGFIPNNRKQTICGFTLLPKDYLCPKDPSTREIHITENTMTIHHFDGSWTSDKEKLSLKLFLKYRKIMPETIARYVAVFVATKKTNGFNMALNDFLLWLKRKSTK